MQYERSLPSSSLHPGPPNQAIRLYATGSTATIPPESPRFIDVPESLQPTSKKAIRLKGNLPKPRDIFSKHRRGSHQNITPEYLDAITPAARRPRGAITATPNSYSAWRLQQSEARRRNLREGLAELARRRIKLNTFLSARSRKRAETREALIQAPEREDDRLNATSVPKMMQRPLRHGSGTLPDPDGPARHAAAVERVQALQQRKAEDTQNALHTLYMRARHFITTDSQLDKAIETQFGNDELPRTWQGSATSFWADAKAQPTTIKEMLERLEKARGGAARTVKDADADANAKLMRDRLGRVAEELTGGKM